MKTLTLTLLLICSASGPYSSVCALEPVWNGSLGWISLDGIKPLHLQGSKWFTEHYGKKTVIKVLGKRYQQQQYISSHAPGEITYTLPLGRKITAFRAVCGLIDGGANGNVIFKVKADEKIVFTSEPISHHDGKSQRIEVEFQPAKSITLIADSNGPDAEDWAVWLEPQVMSGK